MPKSPLTAAVFATLALSVAAPSAGTAGQDRSPAAKPAQEPAPDRVADPMARFARLMPGEWRQTARSGTSMFHTWHWGPGQHSTREMTDAILKAL